MRRFVFDSRIDVNGVVAFADDIACPADIAGEVESKLGALGYRLSKKRSITKGSGATVYLGAPLGEPQQASSLLIEKIKETQSTIDLVMEAEISCQARWQLFSTIVKGMIWRMAATRPEVADWDNGSGSACTVADEMIWKTVLRFAVSTEESASEDSRRLAYAPLTATGLGLPNFSVDHIAMHATAYGLASWPPRPYDKAADKEARRTIREANKSMHEDALSKVKTGIWRSCHHDSHSWIQVKNLHRNLRIRDSAWESALRDTLELFDEKLLINKCGKGEPTRDHYHGCMTCAGGWWTIRHNVVGDAFRQAARAFGLITSAGFKTLYAVGKYDDVPDLIVFDGGARPLVVDFSVTHQSKAVKYDAAQHRTNQKEHKYKDWNSDTSEIVPMVLTTRFTVQDRSVKRLTDIEKNAARRGFAREALAQMKVAQINFEDFRQRQTLTRLHRAGDAMLAAPVDE